MSEIQLMHIMNPVTLVVCSECGRGFFAESDERHPDGSTIFHCTWGGCASEGVTIFDIDLDADEALCFITTEAGLTIGYRKAL